MAGFQFVELLNRHHVYGTETLDLGLERADRLLRGHHAGTAGVGDQVGVSHLGPAKAGHYVVPPAAISASSVSGSDSSAVIAAASGVALHLFHLLDIRQYLVERSLNGLLAQLAEMGEIALRSGSCNVQFASLCADLLEHLARFANDRIVSVDADSNVRRGLIGLLDVLAQRGKSANIVVKEACAVSNRLDQCLALRAHLLELRGARGHSPFDIARYLLEPCTFGNKRRWRSVIAACAARAWPRWR